MNLEKHIAELASENTYRRTGWELEVCRLDARMRQGVWSPEDTLPIISVLFARKYPKLAGLIVRIYLKINGKKPGPSR